MDPRSPDPQRPKRVDLLEMYDVAIAELRSLNDPSVSELLQRLQRHREQIDPRGLVGSESR
jgi:hypothetical protein